MLYSQPGLPVLTFSNKTCSLERFWETLWLKSLFTDYTCRCYTLRTQFAQIDVALLMNDVNVGHGSRTNFHCYSRTVTWVTYQFPLL